MAAKTKSESQTTQIFSELLVLAQKEARSGSWVVAVCPEDCLTQCRNIVAGMAGTFSGKTMVFPEGGKLTVLGPGEDLSTDKPLKVIFIGWTTDKAHKRVLGKWRERATEMVQKLL